MGSSTISTTPSCANRRSTPVLTPADLAAIESGTLRGPEAGLRARSQSTARRSRVAFFGRVRASSAPEYRNVNSVEVTRREAGAQTSRNIPRPISLFRTCVGRLLKFKSSSALITRARLTVWSPGNASSALESSGSDCCVLELDLTNQPAVRVLVPGGRNSLIASLNGQQ